MLEAVTGVRSSHGLDQPGRRAVIEHLKSCGAEFRPARKSGLKRNPPEPPPHTRRQIRKIGAMLAEDGLPDAYAEAILQRMCSHPHRLPLQWATGKQLGNVIAALSYRKKRTEDAQTTLKGLIASTSRLVDSIAVELGSIWAWRRKNPTALVQPERQWAETAESTGFLGYRPGESQELTFGRLSFKCIQGRDCGFASRP